MADERHAREVKRLGHGENPTPLNFVTIIGVRGTLGKPERRHVERDYMEALRGKRIHRPAPKLTPRARAMDEEDGRTSRRAVLLNENLQPTRAYKTTAHRAGQRSVERLAIRRRDPERGKPDDHQPEDSRESLENLSLNGSWAPHAWV